MFHQRRSPDGILPLIALLCLSLMILFGRFVAPASRRQAAGAAARRVRYTWGLVFLLFFLISILMVSCGGGGQGSAPVAPPPNPGTPSGTYTVTITAASGTLSHQAVFTVIVQ